MPLLNLRTTMQSFRPLCLWVRTQRKPSFSRITPRGEHRIVPRLYIRPRSNTYDSSNRGRTKPNLHTIKFSPDGKVIAASLSNGRIVFYDTEHGKTKYNADSGDPRHEKYLWNPEENEGGEGKHKDYRESNEDELYHTRKADWFDC